MPFLDWADDMAFIEYQNAAKSIASLLESSFAGMVEPVPDNDIDSGKKKAEGQSPWGLLMYCFAISGNNALEAERLFWELPLPRLWQFLHCWFVNNGTQCRFVHDQSDSTSLLRKYKQKKDDNNRSHRPRSNEGSGEIGANGLTINSEHQSRMLLGELSQGSPLGAIRLPYRSLQRRRDSNHLPKRSKPI